MLKKFFRFSQKKVVDTFVDAFLDGLNCQERNESKRRKTRKESE